MRRVKKEMQLFERVRIVDAGAEGNAIGRINDKVIFIPFVVPGDVVDVQTVWNKKSFYKGRAIRICEYSEKRTEPKCSHFGICGGCRWQNMKYSEQLIFKQKLVEDSMSRIGKFAYPEILPIIPSTFEYYYRNKLEFTFSNRRWLTKAEMDDNSVLDNTNGLGFHIPGMYDRIVDIENCYLQAEPSNSIRKALRAIVAERGLTCYDAKNHNGFLRNLIIRTTTTGELMVIMVFAYDDQPEISNLLDFISDNFPLVSSLMYVVNSKKNDTITDLEVKLYKGKDHLMEIMGNLKFKIGPVSFFQTNSVQAYELYKIAKNFAELQGNEIVYDLYTGTGTIANFLAAYSAKVIGIDSVSAATEDARINSEINNIKNTVFFEGDIVKVLSDLFVDQNGKPDVIITDPPRAGMHEKVVEQILKIAPRRLVYISCNPPTQARDVNLLSAGYRVVKVQPVDMFPQTQHVENVMVLEKMEA